MTYDRPRATIGTGNGRPVWQTQDRICAYLEAQYEPATLDAVAAACRLTPEVAGKHLRELRAAGRVLSVGYAPRMWIAGPAPAGWSS